MFRVIYFVLTIVAAVSNAHESGTLPRPEGRIIGGTVASIYDFPHQVSIQLYGGGHRFGGSIVSENVVITLASWIHNVGEPNITIVAGTTFLSDPKVAVPVRKVITHPKYDFKNQDYNVALLVLSSRLPIGPGIQAIPLAKERPPAGTVVTVTGWGFIYAYGDLPDQLHQVDVNLLSQMNCRQFHTIFLTNRMLCTSVPGGRKDPCDGDEGGPLIVNNTLLGVVIPFVVYCGNEKNPKVYISVPDVYNWIADTIQEYANTRA